MGTETSNIIWKRCRDPCACRVAGAWIFQKYKKFKVFERGGEDKLFVVHRRFIDLRFEKCIKYLKKRILFVKIKIEILINAQSIGKSKYFVQK